MNKVRIHGILLSCCLFWVLSVASACKGSGDINPPKSYPVADGTFIQDNLVANWDDTRWQNELRALKDAGMHYIVFAPSLHTRSDDTSEAMYPCSIPGIKQKYVADLVENCLRNAERAGFKVFLGLNFNEKWWNPPYPVEWLSQQMDLGNKVADDLVKRYKNRYGNVMYGWYWVWEVDNLNWQTTDRQDLLAKALNTNLDHLHTITPAMPFMLCPFMNYKCGNSTDYRKMWEYVFAGTHFKAGDIFAPQDCIGAGGLKLELLAEWFSQLQQAVFSIPGLQFWSDAETFDQRFWTSAPLDRFVEQMNIVQPFVSNIITFAYSHYYSPYYVNKKFHEAYLEYVRTGTLPLKTVPDPVTNLTAQCNGVGEMTLIWYAPKNQDDLVGYYIFRNDFQVGNVQFDRSGYCDTVYSETAPPKKGIYRYEVCAYNCVGKTSSKISVDWNNN